MERIRNRKTAKVHTNVKYSPWEGRKERWKGGREGRRKKQRKGMEGGTEREKERKKRLRVTYYEIDFSTSHG